MANILFVVWRLRPYYATSPMLKEAASLQFDMFSGDLVDTRTASQKKKDEERTNPQQIQLFKTPEVVQFGVTTKSAYREWLNQATAPPLVLQMIETRTPEEIERDLLSEAQKQMNPLFGEDVQDVVEVAKKPDEDTATPDSVVVFDAKVHCCQRGLRARLRAQSIPVRRRS